MYYVCVCVCVCVCVYVCVCVFCGLSSFFVLVWRVCVWWFGGGFLGSFSSFSVSKLS